MVKDVHDEAQQMVPRPGLVGYSAMIKVLKENSKASAGTKKRLLLDAAVADATAKYQQRRKRIAKAHEKKQMKQRE